MHRIAFALATIVSIYIASPAFAQTVITQAKALAGNVTPGDTAGYPITLSQPGAYRLDSNLTVPNGQYGIFAGADGIDIDLNGFAMMGSGVGTYGIVSNRTAGRIHDGVITQFRYSAIYLRSSDWTIDGMKILKSGQTGIDADDQNRISVLNSTIVGNGTSGIRTRDNAVIRNNVVSLHTNLGIYINGNGLVEENNISENSRGLFIYGGLVTANSFTNNTSRAIEGNLITSVANNSFYRNNESGANQTTGSINVYGNTCIGNPF